MNENETYLGAINRIKKENNTQEQSTTPLSQKEQYVFNVDFNDSEAVHALGIKLSKERNWEGLAALERQQRNHSAQEIKSPEEDLKIAA